MLYFRLVWCFMAVLVVLAWSCATDGRTRALDQAASAGWRRVDFEGQTFTLAGWLKHAGGQASCSALVVYIEGDGAAFDNRRTPAADPTPRDPMAFKLALADPAPCVLYLARPCHYVTDAARRSCEVRYWTDARYSEPVIADLDAAITRGKALCNATTIDLVGYSGGGVVAVLLAARRADVRSLLTVAANLDLGGWTRLHDVTPLRASLDPMDVAPQLRTLRQIHFVGAEDNVVPAAVVQPFVDRVGNPALARLELVAGQSHHCCWQLQWPSLLSSARKANFELR